MAGERKDMGTEAMKLMERLDNIANGCGQTVDTVLDITRDVLTALTDDWEENEPYALMALRAIGAALEHIPFDEEEVKEIDTGRARRDTI